MRGHKIFNFTIPEVFNVEHEDNESLFVAIGSFVLALVTVVIIVFLMGVGASS